MCNNACVVCYTHVTNVRHRHVERVKRNVRVGELNTFKASCVRSGGILAGCMLSAGVYWNVLEARVCIVD